LVSISLKVLVAHKAKHMATQPDFLGYISFKMLDTLGTPGSYKKFMMARREHKAPWALTMHASVAAVQQAIKDLLVQQNALKNIPHLQQLYVISQHVLDSNMPPLDLQFTVETCSLTKKPNVPCIIIKGKGRCSPNFPVHNRFSIFFFHLWIISKMDVIIKVYLRNCIHEMQSDSPADLAKYLQEQKAQSTDALAHALCNAFYHVANSIRQATQTTP